HESGGDDSVDQIRAHRMDVLDLEIARGLKLSDPDREQRVACVPAGIRETDVEERSGELVASEAVVGLPEDLVVVGAIRASIAEQAVGGVRQRNLGQKAGGDRENAAGRD